MIRVRILAESSERAERIAELLTEDERIEILDALSPSSLADVIVSDGVAVDPGDSETSTVLLSENELVTYESHGRAWLPSTATAMELCAAVCAAAYDLTVLTEKQAQAYLPGRNAVGESRYNSIERLTNRELQVLKMVADGFGNKAIANELGISEHTAKFHVGQILAKLGVGSRTEAVTIAIRRGLVPI